MASSEFEFFSAVHPLWLRLCNFWALCTVLLWLLETSICLLSLGT